jgi:membrane protein required for colicin V production
MTWVDAAVLGVVLLSGLFAFLRGFVREVLGVGAWVGAAVIAVWAAPHVRPFFARWLGGHPGMDILAAYAAVFLVSVAVLLLLSHNFSRFVRGSALGGLDRSLGLLFGLARGVAIVALAYIIGGWLAGDPQQWPSPVRDALALGPTYRCAAWVASWLPPGYQPRVYPPPGGRPETASELFRAAPHGRAMQPATARQ